MILGPWDHLEGSSGAEVADAGYGTLAELQLRWFDHWIKGRDGHLGEIAPVTYFEQGTDRWRTARRWVDRSKGVHTRLLSGSSMQGGKAGGLRAKAGVEGESTLLPLPVSGLCTRSANQWTAGILNKIWPDNPCLNNNDVNDLHRSHVPDPQARPRPPLPRADQRAPVRLLDRRRRDAVGRGRGRRTGRHGHPDHRRVAGHLPAQAGQGEVAVPRRQADPAVAPVQPCLQATAEGGARSSPVDVEIFPTAAVIRPGHRLRLTVQGYDVPHLLGTIPDIPTQALPITLYNGPEHRSSLTLPRG